MARQKKTHDPFRWFDSSPEVIRLVVMMYVGIVICGWPLRCKCEVGLVLEICRGAVICPACLRGADVRWP
jgi:hypothetical protein